MLESEPSSFISCVAFFFHFIPSSLFTLRRVVAHLDPRPRYYPVEEEWGVK